MCKVVSPVVGTGCLLRPVPFPGKTLLALALIHSILQVQTFLSLQVSPDFLLLHSSPLWCKGNSFLVLILKGLVGLHRTFQLQLLRY